MKPGTDFNHGLNDRQREAVETLEGPLLIVAGAGSGKTRVLTYRIANLIHQKKAKPSNILAVTFTNKAAKEMRDRVLTQLNLHGNFPLWVTTFHSACVRILREEIDHLKLGYNRNFIIYDDQDQQTVIKRCLKALNIDEKYLNPRSVHSKIDHAKNKGLNYEKLLAEALSSHDEKIGEVYKAYEESLRKANALDFGDLLLLTLELFQKEPMILQKYQDQFSYCLVDEYQDTNRVQYLLMKHLVNAHHNICVVGDEDQSIYSWRGADISNILSFEKDFPKARVIKLEQNYRSTQHIIEASSSVIANNRSRKPKKLWTENQKGTPIAVWCVNDEYGEARLVAKEILKAKDEGKDLKDISIFYRTNAQSRVLEEVLREYNLPYQVYGGIHFYGRAEIKDILAYFKLISNDVDNVSFGRVINQPPRGIGKTTVDKLNEMGREKNKSLYETAKDNMSPSLFNKGTIQKIQEFINLIEELKKEKENLNPQELYHLLLDKTRYIQILKEEDTIEAENRIENLEELDAALGEYMKRNPKGTLEEYLQEISLVSDLDKMDESVDHVKLMTLHTAKGLEFPIVFMVGLEEGLFPHSQREWDPDDLEEERRLCYVGMTRAKEHLCMSYATSRRIYGTPQFSLPSRFLEEIPEEYVTRVDLRKMVRRIDGHRKQSKIHHEIQDVDNDFGAEDDFSQEVESNPFFPGLRLRHPSFGSGVICRVEGSDDSTKVTIKFDNGHVKKFMAIQTPFERVG